MACNPAPTCRAALSEASMKWPSRSKASDGICPSAAHTKANPTSDHETGNAYDLTDDPGAGCDTALLTQQIVGRQDPRVKYVIADRRIYGPGSGGGWAGKAYTGTNPHTSHMHVSIYEHGRNDMSPWFAGGGVLAGGIGGQIGLGGPSDGIGITDALGITTAIGGNIAGQALDPLAQLGQLLGFLTNGENWLRVVMFVGGLGLAIAGAVMLVADTRAARVAVDAAVKVKSAGQLDTDFAEGGDSDAAAQR